MATVTSSKRQLTHTSNTYESNGDVTIGGNLNINGTTTTIDTANLLVEDKNIIIGDVSSPTDSTADGGGITLKGATDKTINWVNSTDSWTSNQKFSAPSLTLTGLTTSSETTALLINASNQVVKRTLGSNAFNSTSFLTSYTETDTLATVTGRGATTSQAITINNQLSTTNTIFARKDNVTNYTNANIRLDSFGGSSSTVGIGFHISGQIGKYLRMNSSGVLAWEGSTVWHAGNDGTGTGLDADLLDGNHASAFATASHTHAASDITSGTLATARIPSLAASKITSGTFADARIPSLAASKITSGTLSNSRLDSTIFRHRGTLDLTSSSGGNNGLPFDDGHTETRVAEYGTRALSYSGASATMLSINTGGSASVFQIGAHYNGNDFYMRTRTDSSTWQTWKKLFHDSYHPNADKLTTARNIALTGAVTGNTNFDGSGNISIATTATADPTLTLSGDASGAATFTNLGNATLSVTVADDSHNHIISNVDGLQSALDGKATAGDENIIDGAASIWNADGDGDVFHYNDSNPTHNGKATGAVLNIRGDGSNDHSLVRAGIFTSNHVSTANGYYVGTLLGTSNSTTTQVINGSGEWTGSVIPAAKLSTATTQSSSENSTKIATTAYVKSQGYITSADGGNATTLDGIDSSAFLRSNAADTASGVISFTGGHGAINITNSSILSSATSNWTGNPGGAGKIQYHSNRWYIVSDSSSNRVVQFRRNSSDVSYIANNGDFIGNVTGALTGNASTATTLATARTIAGTSFNGSANISISYNNLTNKPTIPSAYSLPLSSSSTRGGVKIGFSESGKNYPVELDSSEKMFVNVPWSDTNTDTNTTYSAGTGLTLSGTTFSITDTISSSASNNTIVKRHSSGYIFANYFNTTPNTVSSGVTQICVETGNDGYIRHGTAAAVRSFINVASGANNYSLPAGSSSTRGGFKIGYAESGKYYPVEVSSEKMFVHVPWTDTNTNTTYSAGTGISLSGTTFSLTDTASKANLSGATFTGDVTIGNGSADTNLHIKKSDNNVSDHIVFYNGTTRVGEIGVEDTTWLRINQETAKNIYTPRMIRADGGFLVDGTSKGIDGSGNFFGGTITGASDANVSNWNTAYGWGNHASAGYVTSSGNTVIGTDSDINTSGATVVDQLNMTDGVIQSHSTRTLTLANLGYTGATNANNYSLPAGSSSTRGGFKIGFSESGKNYPVETSSEKMYVNVPWTDTNTDTNTTYSAGRGLDLSGTEFQLETDLRDSISLIGLDSNDYLQWSNNSYLRSVVAGVERFRVSPSGIDVTGTATANAFRTDTVNSDYNVISRNSTSTTLWVQAAQSGSIQGIASFRYGSATVNAGTEVCAIRKNSSYFINTKLGVGTNNPSTSLDVSGTIHQTVYNATGLPSAYPAGQRAFAYSYYTLASSHGSVVNTNGSYVIPVYSDGSSWRAG